LASLALRSLEEANALPGVIARLHPYTAVSLRKAGTRLVALVPVYVSSSIQKLLKGRLVLRGYLDADEHTPIVRAVVAVVKQADIPGVTHARQEVQECARASGNSKRYKSS